MHIGLITADLTPQSGWATYSLHLAQALHAAGVQVRIVAPHSSPSLDPLPVLPILPSVTPPERLTLFKLAQRMPQVRDHLRDCDIIHTTVEVYAPLAAAIAAKRPLFMTGHGSYVNLPRFRRFPVDALYRWAFRQAHLIAVSRYTAQAAARVVPTMPATVINNAVDAARFQQVPSLAMVNEQKRGPTILTAGGIKKRKGTLPLIEAVAQVRQTIPDIQCVVLGTTTAEPHYTAQVQATIDRLNLHDHVQLRGFVDDSTLLAWYGAADVFVLPSINDGWKFEGFGLVHLEASAAGLPVIGTTGCGVTDAIDHNITGLLVDQSRLADDLPRAILDVLQNPARAAQMGAAGRQKAQAQTWQVVAQQVIHRYESALSGGKTASN